MRFSMVDSYHIKFFRLSHWLIHLMGTHDCSTCALVTPSSTYDNMGGSGGGYLYDSTWWSVGALPQDTWLRVEFYFEKSTKVPLPRSSKIWSVKGTHGSGIGESGRRHCNL